MLCALAACGSSGAKPDPTPTLTWYVGPDRADLDGLARTCTSQAGGAYDIRVEQLPADVSARHALLVRRLQAKDTSIDILSLDSAFTAEFAAAQYLAPLPEELKGELGKDIAPAALAAATYDGQLAVAPWWFDPQLLWYRGNVAERAGLDTTKPISWDDLVAGAERIGVTIQIADEGGTGLAQWVNALVAGAGGTLVKGTGRDAEVGLDTPAGRTAASVVEFYLDSGRGPGPTADALKKFAAPDGGFLLAPSSVISDPDVAAVASDMAWTAYPTVTDTSVAPLSGVGLAVPLYAPRSELSYQAITCLTSPTVLSSIMAAAGHSASRLTTYDDPAVKRSYPMAAVTRPAVQSGTTLPVTPYWQVAQSALDDTWLPLSDFSQDTTLERSQKALRAAIAGELP
ncbi:extracellular solute-binding protein [Aeromicrobium sp. NPDC092404]|uniref:extracellular solute-binding protein n=1 Tax=Aeromicrobium sp. NPDC092404 TaxID=3154976 RepID=UPI003448D07E